MSPIGVDFTLTTITVMVYEDPSNALVLDGPISLRSHGVTLKEWALAGLGGVDPAPAGLAARAAPGVAVSAGHAAAA